YMQGIEKNGDTFTIRDWMRGVQEKGHNSWLFITSDAANHASLKPVISMWLSIAIRSLLAIGDNRERRVWIIADELPTLHKLPDLIEILPEARKFGGCFVLGFQSYAQLQDIYGNKGALTLFDVLNTRFFFRATTKEMAEFAAGEIGESEIQKASEQYSYEADPVRDGVSVGKDMQRVQLVSYSDIQSLHDLTCFITLPGPYPVVKMTLKYHPYPKVAPNFIARNVNLDMDKRLANVIAARENERVNMDKLFIPATNRNNQEDTQTTATEAAGMTQQKDQIPKTKIQHPESSETLEPPDAKTAKSRGDGKINSHQQQHRQDEVNLNKPKPKKDRRLEL
ncbi:type IV secretion system DNA-binding domain-containing protein, partial [Arsenophonus sp.]|uniref:type IV secretion system DNA-binding domain-containing protein n=1 Tax=Arsenophonus sp. TaxID=1872640 RepID=UPI003879C465